MFLEILNYFHVPNIGLQGRKEGYIRRKKSLQKHLGREKVKTTKSESIIPADSSLKDEELQLPQPSLILNTCENTFWS